MKASIKETVDAQEAKLEAGVKKQEAAAAVAKAKSKTGDGPHSKDSSGFTDDEHWTMNMPDEHLKSFVQKKVGQAIDRKSVV